MLLGRDGIALTGRELSSSGQLVSDGTLTIGSQLLLLSGITKGQEVAIKANQLALDGSLQGDSVALEADQIASGKQGQLLSQTTLKVTAREGVQEEPGLLKDIWDLISAPCLTGVPWPVMQHCAIRATLWSIAAPSQPNRWMFRRSSCAAAGCCWPPKLGR